VTLDLKGSVAVNDPRLDMARGSVSAAAGLPIPTARVRGSADATNPKAAASTGRDGTAVASDFNTVSAAQLNGRFNSGDRPAKTLAAETCFSRTADRLFRGEDGAREKHAPAVEPRRTTDASAGAAASGARLRSPGGPSLGRRTTSGGIAAMPREVAHEVVTNSDPAAQEGGGTHDAGPREKGAAGSTSYSRRGPCCRRGHPWSSNEVRRPDGRRQCRACRNYRARRANWARQGFAL